MVRWLSLAAARSSYSAAGRERLEEEEDAAALGVLDEAGVVAAVVALFVGDRRLGPGLALVLGARDEQVIARLIGGLVAAFGDSDEGPFVRHQQRRDTDGSVRDVLLRLAKATAPSPSPRRAWTTPRSCCSRPGCLGVVADALEGLGDEDQLDVGGGHLGDVAGLAEELFVVLAIQGADLGVTGQHQTGLGEVALDEAVDGQAQDFAGDDAFGRNVEQVLERAALGDDHGALGDDGGLVGDTLKVVADVAGGEEQTDVAAHRAEERQVASVAWSCVFKNQPKRPEM